MDTARLISMNIVPSPNPHGLQIFSIQSIELVQETGDSWWLAAETECGHTIGVRPYFEDEIFCVVVAKDGAPIRSYSGGKGSHAHKVFRGFESAYFGFCRNVE